MGSSFQFDLFTTAVEMLPLFMLNTRTVGDYSYCIVPIDSSELLHTVTITVDSFTETSASLFAMVSVPSCFGLPSYSTAVF